MGGGKTTDKNSSATGVDTRTAAAAVGHCAALACCTLDRAAGAGCEGLHTSGLACAHPTNPAAAAAPYPQVTGKSFNPLLEAPEEVKKMNGGKSELFMQVRLAGWLAERERGAARRCWGCASGNPSLFLEKRRGVPDGRGHLSLE